MTFKSKKKSNFGVLFIMIFILALVAIGYIYLSPAFEQNKPNIHANSKIYWNLRSTLDIKIDDESGIKYYKVIFDDGNKKIVLNQEVLNDVQKSIDLKVNAPKLDMFYKDTDAKIYIEVVDNSKWNLLEGNKATKTIDIKVDTKQPVANVLANSRYIQRGGSGVVVVEVSDPNLKDMYVTFNGEKNFKLMPYKKENYYVALIAWPIEFEKFKKISLVATDKANNKKITKIPFYIQKKTIKTDKIKLNEQFIKNVSASVIEQSFEQVPSKLEDIFIYSNKDLREKNIKTIEDVALKAMENKQIDSFDIKAFKRLRGSKTIAGFAERRHYYLNGSKINEAWHLGIDWASVRKAPIRVSNDGEVIFKDFLGLYGNTIIVDHGMGLASLYAHTSTQNVVLQEQVSKNHKLANTGSTGAVFGDHLHFGMLVQGVEVNPLEWMDRNWIKTRITNILKNANKQIAGKR
ncbi:MAG: M23 family metallopeptidase [Campylobacterota bacterium]|nr:M23 family metallopeptidase [Campylobacterota bacterium]